MILCGITHVNASLLGEINHSRLGGMSGVPDNFIFSWRSSRPIDYPEYFNMELEPISLFDIGTEMQISPSVPDYDFFTSILTNGIDDRIAFAHSNGNGTTYGQIRLESAWINRFAQPYGPDFYGYEITEISITLNDGYLDAHENRTDYYFDVTYSIYGVPEPCTLLLLGIGAVMMRRRQ